MEDQSSELFKSTINEYLDNLPETVHTQLYKSPETCLAIFRLLPSLAKFYIMLLLFQETSIPYSDLNRWIKNPNMHHVNPNKIYQNESIKRLKSLNLLKDIRKRVVHPQTGQKTEIPFVQLNPIFRTSFRNALTGNSGKLSNLFDDESDRITIEFLDNYCLNKWENILHFMVGSEIKQLPSIGVLTLLRYSGLMELPSDHYTPDGSKSLSIDTLSKLLITQNGFQFLLQDINSQIWTLLLQYLKMSEKLMMNPVDVLNFIFMLGSLELGQGYPITMLSNTQIIMLEDLVDYGLIYDPGEIEGNSNRNFYPTRLSTTLTSESCNFKTASTVIDQEISNANSEETKNSSNQGSIIIETNFKIYCYTSSPLQIAVLNLFIHMKARFSNMVTGSLTRESVRRALMNGITADQIINYLESHAHPGMIKMADEKLSKQLEYEQSIGNLNAVNELKLEILPPTVIDQVKLWQLELDRIQTFKGYLYKDFTNDYEFEKLLNYGDEIGVITWKDRLRRKFFVTLEGSSQLIDYANRILRKGGNSGGRSMTPSTQTPQPQPQPQPTTN
ncbi:hypothetical protein CANARDRAFT_201563 [[Candida] arabinofermentans NRRL YB-2248]|uniref:RNA polymerase II transcription factor B subunit 2 n=1 Tax=[Candida] arabinofermentans NRRL YB-2248 TaxID=983967 RepID=A0A1E4SXG9_9ASCO|nr:hypothetical protein CANARDRAFT_201563 [[Candida] arabinofermentans NRRL YB-2248]